MYTLHMLQVLIHIVLLLLDVRMPAKSSGELLEDSLQDNLPPGAKSTATNDTINVPITVHQRVKSMNESLWTLRTSYHDQRHVVYDELDDLLSQNHGSKEPRYAPNLYDANELLTWSPEDLEKAVAEISRGHNIQSVQMSSKSL